MAGKIEDSDLVEPFPRQPRRRKLVRPIEPEEDEEREPWYYGFLSFCAGMTMAVGLLTFVIGIVFVASLIRMQQENEVQLQGVIGLSICGLLGELLVTMFLTALLLLAVDGARSLREMRSGQR